MTSHKLFSDSLNSSILNSTMGSKGDVNVSPALTPIAKRGKPLPPKNSNKEHHIDSPKSKKNSSSDSDSMDEKDFFSRVSEKQPYTFDEDVEILNFVLKDQNVYRVSSIMLWKYLEAKKKNPKRTYQSLKNRFLRNIKPKIFSTYSHLIQNQDQIKKILDKFPELKKEVKIREPLTGLNLPPRKGTEKEIQSQPPPANGASAAVPTSNAKNASTSASASDFIPATVNPWEGEICTRNVKLTNNCVVITLYRKLGTCVPYLYDKLGIYEKYLKFKAENKLIPCSTCGRCGGPEIDEGQESDNDDVIANSVGSRYTRCSVKTKNKRGSAVGDNVAIPSVTDAVVSVAKIVIPRGVASDKVSSLKKVAAAGVNDATRGGSTTKKILTPVKDATSRASESTSPSEKDTASPSSNNAVTPPKHSEALQVKDARGGKRKRKSPEASPKLPVSPSLLDSSKSSAATQAKTPGKNPTPSKTTPKSSSSKKYQTPAEESSGGLTDRELESLYQETVQEHQKLMDSEEEEELVKKCLKKSRRMIGFDSYVLLNRVNLDSFFAKSISPPLDSSDPVTSTETKTEGSPLVENMKKMLRSRSKKS